MREVKFRGKWDHNLWKYGSLLTLSNNYSSEPYYQIISEEGHFNVNTKTIGQYTGRNDCNGAEIYEGDLLKNTYPSTMGEVLYEVYWNVEEACFCVRGFGMNDDGIHRLSDLFRFNPNYIIVNNIHDKASY
jgi:uncharacterized phage protein (TIGR01671 family)